MPRAKGRPPKYRTVKQLQYKVDMYFRDCIKLQKRPKLTGLYSFLGVWPGYFQEVAEDKQADFSKVIRHATIKIAEFYEDAVDNKQTCPALGIFMLKNCGFSDNVNITANVSSSMSLADMAKEARSQKAKQAK